MMLATALLAPQAVKFWEGGPPPKIGSFSKLGEEEDFSQKMIVRTCGETHSVIELLTVYMLVA